MFQAVVIDGEPYWDGGYSGNPTITPLVRECQSHDTFIVQINPVLRPETPMSASEIHNRINEVSFNATLLKELKMISLLRKICDRERRRGLVVGADATACHQQRDDGYAGRVLETQC